MTQIQTIKLALPFRLGSVNCYLVKDELGLVLIDTGSSNKRAELEQELAKAGCKPGDLELVVLTHGDFDHTGNAAYLRHKYGTQVAMHKDDAGMVERGDMFANRKRPNLVIRKLVPIFSGFGKAERFTPDLWIDDGYDFSEHGFAAKCLSIPGHSKGSIGILTAGGDLFCGDFFENQDEPSLSSLMDDRAAANASVEKLRGFEIKTVYPGHGKPFPLSEFGKTHW